jgi:hypothetical protein
MKVRHVLVGYSWESFEERWKGVWTIAGSVRAWLVMRDAFDVTTIAHEVERGIKNA